MTPRTLGLVFSGLSAVALATLSVMRYLAWHATPPSQHAKAAARVHGR